MSRGRHSRPILEPGLESSKLSFRTRLCIDRHHRREGSSRDRGAGCRPRRSPSSVLRSQAPGRVTPRGRTARRRSPSRRSAVRAPPRRPRTRCPTGTVRSASVRNHRVPACVPVSADDPRIGDRHPFRVTRDIRCVLPDLLWRAGDRLFRREPCRGSPPPVAARATHGARTVARRPKAASFSSRACWTSLFWPASRPGLPSAVEDVFRRRPLLGLRRGDRSQPRHREPPAMCSNGCQSTISSRVASRPVTHCAVVPTPRRPPADVSSMTIGPSHAVRRAGEVRYAQTAAGSAAASASRSRTSRLGDVESTLPVSACQRASRSSVNVVDPPQVLDRFLGRGQPSAFGSRPSAATAAGRERANPCRPRRGRSPLSSRWTRITSARPARPDRRSGSGRTTRGGRRA